MESAAKSNGITKENWLTKSFLVQNKEADSGPVITVHQALYKWYSLFSKQVNPGYGDGFIFPELSQDNLLNCLQTDIELIPSVFMEEFISKSLIQDKEHYFRLIQALLTNLSDCLYLKQKEFSSVCNQIENTLQFIQSFFYQYFDMDSILTKFHQNQFYECYRLKFEYWKIKLNHSTLFCTLEDCLANKFISSENNITHRKVSYLKYLLKEIESARTIITEDYVRETFIYNNFNSECFINYETELIINRLDKLPTNQEALLLLQNEQSRVSQLKIRSGISYDNRLPSVKKQLSDWITEEIKQLELKNRKAADKDLLIDPESKVQTSLSVAKLAVLVRLMVVDKIIINKSVAPMLRTVTKLFTTLQKDEISFGSLETKYHAPDKTTLNTMKEMLGKWVNILGKL